MKPLAMLLRHLTNPKRNRDVTRRTRHTSGMISVENVEARCLLTPVLLSEGLTPGAAGTDPQGLVDHLGVAYFHSANILFNSDGTAQGTQQVLDVGGTITSDLYSNDAAIFFTAQNVGAAGDSGIFAWDPVNGLRQAVSTATHTNIDDLTVLGNRLYFTATTQTEGNELFFVTEAQAPSLAGDIWGGVNPNTATANSSSPSSLTVASDILYFVADDGVSGETLWSTDLQNAPSLVEDIIPGRNDILEIADLSEAGSALFFRNIVTNEVWISQGTAATTLSLDVSAGYDFGGAVAGSVAPSGGEQQGIFFFSGFSSNLTATNRQLQLYRTDGTLAGTSSVDITLNFVEDPAVRDLLPVGDALYFVGQEESSSFVELWKLENGVIEQVNHTPATRGTGFTPDALTEVNDRVYFSATTTAEGVELHTAPGADTSSSRLVEDLEGPVFAVGQLPGDSSPQQLTRVGDDLFFTATTAAEGAELYFLDVPALPAIPGQPTILTPTGSASPLPEYTWTPVVDGATYELVVRSASGIEQLRVGGLTATSFTPTIPLDIGAYTTIVTATNSIGQSGVSSLPVQFSVAEPAEAPTLTGPIGNGEPPQPTFTWVAGVNNTSFQLEITDSAGQVITETGLTGTSHRLSVALPSDIYRARLQGINVAGVPGGFSNEILFAVGDAILPGTPTILSPTGQIDTPQPTFEWTAVNNAIQYTIEVTDVFTGTVVQTKTFGRVTSGELDSPFLDGVYQATVTGINIDGQNGPASDPAIFAIGDPQTPAAPVISSPTLGSTVSTSQPPIQWNSVPGALMYDIWMSTTQGVLNEVVRGEDVGAGQLQYVTTTPFPEGNVSVWIRALDPFDGKSEWSTPVRFLVDAITAPQTPVITSPLVNVTANAFPEFSWTGDGANYELWVAKLRDGTGTSQVDPIFDRVVYLRDYIGNSYTHFNPLVNGLYRAWVRARNVAGELSAWSAFEEFSVDVPVPDTPILSVNVTQNSVRPQFSWTTSDEAFPLGTTFDLWVNNLSTGEARVIRERTLTGSSFRAAEDLPQGRYRAWLQASSPLGHKSFWSAAVTFDIDIPSPGQPTVTGPVAALGASDDLIRTVFPEFTWTAQPGAAFYELWVNHDTSRTARIVHQRMVEGTSFNTEQTPVDGSDETVEVPLPQGDYRAWTRAFNVSGEPGPWSRAFAFTIDVADPVAPVITAPVINAVGTVADSTPTIQWTSSGISVVGYQLQLEEVATGTRVLDITDINTEEYTIPDALSEIEYRVRVRGLNGVGEASDWSAFYNFKVDVPNASTPILLSPNGEQTGSSVTFEWQHSPLNTRYEILVRDLLRQENIVIRLTTFELDLTQTVALHTQNGFSAGTYRWWARAFNSEDTSSNWSASATFIVASNTHDESRSDENDPFDAGLPDADVYLAALPVTRDELTSESRQVDRPQVHEPVRVSAAEDRSKASKGESKRQQDADSVELIQVISELADPRSSLLLDGEQRS